MMMERRRRMRRSSLLCACLHLMCFGIAVVVVRCDFAVGPSNQAVVAGQRMEMECRAANGSEVFKWTLKRTTSTKKQWIFRKRNNSVFTLYQDFSCAVDEQGSGIIFKNSTDPGDAGVYFCYDFPDQNQFSALLIVFESEPLCEVNYTSLGVTENGTVVAKGAEVSMRCWVSFRGQWPPSVEWKRHTAGGPHEDGRVMVAGRGVSSTLSSSDDKLLLSSSLDIVVDFDQPTYFSFSLFFLRRDDLDHVDASNLPEFRYKWRSPDMVTEQPRIERVVQVIVETVTSEAKSTSEWYLVSLILLVVVPVIVFSIAAIVIRWCYISYRRTKGLDQRSAPTKPAFLHGLERPASGEYDVIHYAAPNIYDRIEDGETNERDTNAPCQQQQQQQHLPLIHCYSHLSDAALLPPEPYDALTPYLSMDSTPNTPGHCPLLEVPLSERYENRYIEMTKRANTAAPTTKDSYLTLLGEDEATGGEASVSDNDVSNEEEEDDEDEDVTGSRFAKTNGDYLIPFV